MPSTQKIVLSLGAPWGRYMLILYSKDEHSTELEFGVRLLSSRGSSLFSY